MAPNVCSDICLEPPTTAAQWEYSPKAVWVVMPMPRGAERLSMASGGPFRVHVPPPLMQASLARGMPFLSERAYTDDSSNNHQKQDKCV